MFFFGYTFENNLQSLKGEGYITFVRKNNEGCRIIIERDAKTIFSLNVFFSNSGDNIIGFNTERQPHVGRSENLQGTIEPMFNKEQQTAGYELTDYADFGEKGFNTIQEIMEYLWAKMTKQLESLNQ